MSNKRKRKKPVFIEKIGVIFVQSNKTDQNLTPIHQSTLPTRGVTDEVEALRINVGISIHTPREGSDFNTVLHVLVATISIHTPREGSDMPMER